MKAAVFKGAGIPLVVERVDDPTPGPGEAVIKVRRCGVCGTDLHMTSGHGNDAPTDSVIGHEYCGEVVALGQGADRLKIGQFVTAMPVAGCGRCSACLAGYPMACARMQGLVGGFGQYVRIAADSSIVLPDTLSAADGALVEPLAVGLRGVRLAKMQPGARVAVLGAGSIGLAVIYWSRRLGAGKVVALSRSDRRAALAGQMGADAFVPLGEGESEQLQAALGGMPDVIFECTGAVGLTQKAIELVGPAGKVISLGFCTAPDPFLPSLATWKQVTMTFSFAYDLREFQHSADTLAAGHVEPRAMISRTVGLDGFPALFEALRAGSDETKVHVDPLGGSVSDMLLAPDALLAASSARTGLTDFGDPAFREGLDLLLADIRALDLAPEFAGASAWRIGQSLDTRALAVAGLKWRPDLLDAPIREPIVIARLVRSGTTALHLLMSLDPQFQGPEHWLTVYPMPRPPRAKWPAIPEYRAEKQTLDRFLAAAPEAADDHMMTAEGIEESLFILGASFASNMWPSMWNAPKYDAWYRRRDDSDSYRWLADVLRLIGAGDERRWLLKNPTDLFSLREVLGVFPDACIIQTHRDPIDAIPSVSNLIFAARRAFCGAKADPADVGRRETMIWAEALERAHQARSASTNLVVDVDFRDFTRDQMSTVRRIYDAFGLVLAPEAESAMQAWLAAHPRRQGMGPKHRPENFGLTRDGLARAFAPIARGKVMAESD